MSGRVGRVSGGRRAGVGRADTSDIVSQTVRRWTVRCHQYIPSYDGCLCVLVDHILPPCRSCRSAVTIGTSVARCRHSGRPMQGRLTEPDCACVTGLGDKGRVRRERQRPSQPGAWITVSEEVQAGTNSHCCPRRPNAVV